MALKINGAGTGLFAFALLFLSGQSPVQAQPGIQAGVAASVRGLVKVYSRAEQKWKPVSSGDPVLVGDEIASSRQGSLQILLRDQTTFTVGPNSQIAIDEFVFDNQADDDPGLVTRVSKGAFRYLSGQIGKKDPASVRIELPVGTIGIRGTAVFASVPPGITGNVPGDVPPAFGDQSALPGNDTDATAPAGGPTGGPTGGYVALLGPGQRNGADTRPGGLVFQPANGGPATSIIRAGFGLGITAAGLPGEVGRIPADVSQTMARAMTPPPAAAPASASESRPGRTQTASRPGGPGMALRPVGNESGMERARSRHNGEHNEDIFDESSTAPGDAPPPPRPPSLIGELPLPPLAVERPRPTIAAITNPPSFGEIYQFAGTGTYARSGIPIHAAYLGGPAPLRQISQPDLDAEISRIQSLPVIGSYGTSITVDFGSKKIANWNITNIDVPSMGVTGQSVYRIDVPFDNMPETNNAEFQLPGPPPSVGSKFAHASFIMQNVNGSADGGIIHALEILDAADPGAKAGATGVARISKQ